MDISDIKHLANLSRLELSEEECASYAKEMEAILAYVEQVRESADDSQGIDTTAGDSFVENVFRDDVVLNKAGQYTDALISLAPKAKGKHLLVKKILSTGDNS